MGSMRIGESRGVSLLGGVVVFGSIALVACGGAARLDGTSTDTAGSAGQPILGSGGNNTEAGGAPGVAGSPATGGALSVAGAGGAVIDCAGVSCVLNCSRDEFWQTTPGECCPRCVSQSPECLKGQADFQKLYGTLIQRPGATSCVTNDDCTVLPSFSKCGYSCGGATVSVTSSSELIAELSQFEAANCSTCMQSPGLCPVSPPAVCVSGTCQAYYRL